MDNRPFNSLPLIQEAIMALNETRDDSRRIPPGPETILFGHSGHLDSLGLVALIVEVEERINDALGTSITIADERAMSQARSPFRSVATLAEYVDQLVKEEQIA